MRWFSRLHSWLRAEPGDRASAPQQLTFYPGPLPEVPADNFRRRFLRAVAQSDQNQQVVVVELDPTVRIMVLPTRDDGEVQSGLGPQIDNAIHGLESGGRVLSSLTWSALRDARPGFSPSFADWAGNLAPLFDGGIGMVFFVDLEGIVEGAVRAAQHYGFTPTYDEDNVRLVVRDERYCAHIGVHALLAEALWTGRGPHAVISRRGRGLPSEFRAFLAFEKSLERRFPDVSFLVENDHILAHEKSGAVSRIDYRHACASIRARGMSIDNWLSRIVLWDLAHQAGDPHLQLKSPVYSRAFDDRMVRDQGPYAVLMARQTESGRTEPVPRFDDEPVDRFAHYEDEAKRQSGFIRYQAHAFVIEDGEGFAVGLVGDKIASVALSPHWVAGVLEQLTAHAGDVTVSARSEDALLIRSATLSHDALDGAERFLKALSDDLLDDGSDELSYSVTVTLPVTPAGLFELELVDGDYFRVRFAAEEADGSHPGRAHHLRALAFQSLGRFARAGKAYEKAIRSDRSNGAAFLAYGQMLVERGDAERAEGVLEAATVRLPENAEAQNALGLALSLRGQVAAASSAFESAVRLDPTEAAFLINLGKSYSDGHQYHRAQACLERALSMVPDSAEAHAVMAVVCLRTGDPGGARRHAREALLEAPEDQSVRQLLSALENDPDE